MKKSELRKIIKESIKGLMTEQPWPINNTGCQGFAAAMAVSPQASSCCPKCLNGLTIGQIPMSTNHGCYSFCTDWGDCCKCDTSPNSNCAQNWFGPLVINMTNFMANKVCGPAGPGISTFQGAGNNAYNQFTDFVSTYPVFSIALLTDIENSTDWAGIHSTVNIYALAVNQTSGIAMPPMDKGKMKRAYAKFKWAECMMGDCGC